MGKKDQIHSKFYDNPERFADVFNGCLFQGKQVIRPGELEDIDSVFTFTTDDSPGGSVTCDKVKKWKGVYFSILILQYQTYIDYFMVLRGMKGEVAAYDRQRQRGYEKALEEKRKPDINERLCRMFKDQTFYPVVTLVLYLDTKNAWDGKTELYDLLTLDDVLKPYITNYKLNLYDYHHHTDFSVFKTENRILFELLSVCHDKDELMEHLKSLPPEYCKDRYVVKTLLDSMNIKVDLKKIYDKKQGGYDMCKAVDDLVMEGRKEGRKEGIKFGVAVLIETMRDLGQSNEFIIGKIIEKFDLTEMEAKSYL